MAETIEWQLADGTGAIALAGAEDCVGEFRVAPAPTVQPVQALRAETAQHLGRGNVSTRVSFLVTYAEAASAEAAKAAIVAKAAALQPATLTHALLEGVFGDLVWQLQDCAMEPAELWQVGVTVFARFSFIGGALVDATPESP